ncbi:hypothetical protein CEXT_413471 [Caerostris extrusa]|uniref:Uncharacterized protein n=1 Tax=Caerostris extrusa TaxID=172846 RepID=A0AAV4Q402_CAEEX|nr:hypothetical protein CEXT_413471 [Caerostris extrusa]
MQISEGKHDPRMRRDGYKHGHLLRTSVGGSQFYREEGFVFPLTGNPLRNRETEETSPRSLTQTFFLVLLSLYLSQFLSHGDGGDVFFILIFVWLVFVFKSWLSFVGSQWRL